MRIRSLWGMRPDGEELPELLEAWDEYSIDENHEGFATALNHAQASFESGSEFRVVEFEVPLAALREAFAPVEIAARITQPTSSSEASPDTSDREETE